MVDTVRFGQRYSARHVSRAVPATAQWKCMVANHRHRVAPLVTEEKRRQAKVTQSTVFFRVVGNFLHYGAVQLRAVQLPDFRQVLQI